MLIAANSFFQVSAADRLRRAGGKKKENPLPTAAVQMKDVSIKTQLILMCILG